MHDHNHDHGGSDLHEWLKDAIEVSDRDLEAVRKIPQIPRMSVAAWKRFPDAGVYQMTKLTGEMTGGACNSYFIRLNSGEVFPIHKHPHAVHIMIGIEGEGSICWREPGGPKYRAVIKHGNGVFAITPETEHAILADRGCDLMFLVINAPAEDIHRHDYQVHVHKHESHEHS